VRREPASDEALKGADAEPMKRLFDRLDEWRHFPSYQLERRADIFFSLYLVEVLEAKLGFGLRDTLAPEFPVRIGTIDPHTPVHASYKIDYLALSADGTRPIFVEPKTDDASRREAQDSYLKAAQSVGLTELLAGLLDIFRATQSKRKYFCYLVHLERMGLLEIPGALTELMRRASLRGATAASRAIRVCNPPFEPPVVVYVQPHGEGPDVVSFREFAEVVSSHDDPVSRRFAASLIEWAEIRAGCPSTRPAAHGSLTRGH
jgi:hypothetical protein